MAIPVIFSFDKRSFKNMKAAKSENTGMVAIITADIVGDENFTPKLSPKKYKNGLKKADAKNSFMSLRFGIINWFAIRKPNRSKKDEITNLTNTTDSGPR